MKKVAIITLLIIFYPSISFAYIDPGILSIAVQGLYALIAGAAFTYIITPWHKLKSLINKLLGKKKDELQTDEHDV